MQNAGFDSDEGFVLYSVLYCLCTLYLLRNLKSSCFFLEFRLSFLVISLAVCQCLGVDLI